MMKPNAIPDRRTFKTSADFLYWLKKRAANQERAVEEKAAQSARIDLKAMMVWVDDGGQGSETIGEDKPHLGG